MNFRIETPRESQKSSIKKNVTDIDANRNVLTSTNEQIEYVFQKINGTRAILQISSENFTSMIKDQYLNINDDGTGSYLYGIDITGQVNNFVVPQFENVTLDQGLEYYQYMFSLLVQQTIDPRSITDTSEVAVLHTKIQLACTTQNMENGALIVLAESNFTCLGEINLASNPQTVTMVPLAYQNVSDNSLLKINESGDWGIELVVKQQSEQLKATLESLIQNNYQI